MKIRIGLFAVVTLTLLSVSAPKCDAQVSFPGAVLRAFNVSYTSGGERRIAVSTWFAYESLDVALSTPFGSDFTHTVEDPCSINIHPCSGNARCIDVNAEEGLLQCKCNKGFNQTASTRTFDSISGFNIIPDGTFCPDIDECEDNNLICGPNTASCVNTPGSYICVCKSGFFLTEDKICDNINECTNDTLNNCSVNSTCINTVGSFSCRCKPGLTGDGVNCEDINECADSPCHRFADCLNMPGSYVCSCGHGFAGDGFSCEDEDECSSDPCHEQATCKNTVGSFTCLCNDGFTGSGIVCTDVNECEIFSPCHEDANCKNTDGAFSCECKTGFTGNGFICSGSKLSYCYRMAVSIHNISSSSVIGEPDTKMSDPLTFGITNLIQELQEHAFEFVYDNVDITVEDSLDIDASTKTYVANACFENTVISAPELTTILENFIPESTFEGFLISVSDFDECALKYRTCVNPFFACTNTDGGYECVKVLNEKEETVAKTIMLSFYSPILGPSPLIRLLMKRKHVLQAPSLPIQTG